ncbi:Hint domain-containing protein [Aliiroseovarius sp. Z3]|uniref:Hint domain-containing protein n=1 Tax=Aliiroseovarius sp. Z3 TaxID=2811402 RepID=UPI0023B277F7|nr:Hint domain-containing protein [Aliiroseovarius sp. Z3]MDE9451892.1 Hint domain-containing protein [Aliiroseovarius sp. Z3]MDE9452050.1 Hint domain-containing protein [Aliiroseovarius sp. Z3]
MADIVINAGAGALISENFGGNGEDDTITLNILEDFTGSINIATGQIDGEIETLNIVLPEGWVTVTATDVPLPGETPPVRVVNATIIDDQGAPRGNFSVISNIINVGVVCFSRGTKIKTDRGYIAIEELGVGDRVQTLDCGYQPIRWIGSTRLDAIDLKLTPKLRPIRIRAGALGINSPTEDLLVSPQHRVLSRSAIALRILGEREVLLPANKLLPLSGIEIDQDAKEVEYFHILFDAHQLIYANGSVTESLFVGKEALKSLSAKARQEIETLFPAILDPNFMPKPVRLIPERGRLIKKLVQRHYANARSLVL